MAFSLAALPALPALAQPTGATLVTSALNRSLGIATDMQGRVWVAQTGSAPDAHDGSISVVLPDGQVFPFLTGLATGGDLEELRGISHLLLDGDDLWFTLTTSGSSGALYHISTAGFTPGDAPRTEADVMLAADVATFVFAQGYTDSNAYGLAIGPDGALYLTDAGANVVLRYDQTLGVLSVLTAFPDLPNPTPIGPPFVNTVPTGIVSADGRLYVSILTGFPFAEGLARVYAVEMDGTFAVHHGGLTALDDLARDPRDGALTVLQHATFGFAPPPPGWRPETGRAIRLDDGATLASAFSFASGLAYDAAGTLYVATLGGALYRVATAPAACQDPATGPRYAGGYVLNAAGTRAFLALLAPRGAGVFEFYNTTNLVVGSPEADLEGGTALPGVTRVGDRFAFAAGSEPTEAYFPILRADPQQAHVAFFLRVTDTCNRTVDVDPDFALTGVETQQAGAPMRANVRPDPFTSATTIHFTLAQAGYTRLAVYDVLGREVARLLDGAQQAGEHHVPFSGALLPAGVYFYRLEAGGQVRTGTLTLAR